MIIVAQAEVVRAMRSGFFPQA